LFSDYTQSKPAVPVEAVCGEQLSRLSVKLADSCWLTGKCIIFKYDDDAKEDELPLVELSEGQSSMDSQGVDTDELDTRAATVDEIMHVGGGKWSDDDHLFYYRTSLLGLGKNWRRTLKKFVRSLDSMPN
jgi:hypothetical protein